MSGRVVFVSPHLDDVVLSCPRWVIAEAERARVSLVTVFSAGPESETRKREDLVAAELLGVSEVEHLDLPDAPELGFLGFAGLLLGGERPIVPVIDALGPVLAGAERVYGPLAVGNHVDHRATHDALAALAPPGMFWYVDQPYARVDGMLAMRLGGSLDPVRWRHSFEASCWVRAFTTQGDRDALAARYPTPPTRHAGKPMESLSGPSDRSVAAIRAYASQVPTLYGDEPPLPAEETVYAFRPLAASG